MLISGLVSVTFRALTCEEIISHAAQNGLRAIEWGADVHVPVGDERRAREVYERTAAAGLTVAAYGSYYRLGQGLPREEFEKLLANAALLRTDTVRVWAGGKGSAEYTEAEKQELVREALFLSELAAKQGVRLCFECHPHTLTDEKDAAAALMQAINRDNVKMYWQPNQYKTVVENSRYLQAILPWLTNLHVFHWRGEEKRPLALAKEEWQMYFDLANSDGKKHYCLLEFMPDGKPESLAQEAEALKTLLCKNRRIWTWN